MLAMERDRLDKQRAFREQELQRKQCAESPGPKSLAPSAAAPVAVCVRERPRLCVGGHSQPCTHAGQPRAPHV